ncbi:hypothetical protein T08_8050 [Trichinella sp. T8]|nr:hypothetical protein T08_8050 [Trichinella sp. T8]
MNRVSLRRWCGKWLMTLRMEGAPYDVAQLTESSSDDVEHFLNAIAYHTPQPLRLYLSLSCNRAVSMIRCGRTDFPGNSVYFSATEKSKRMKLQ